MQNAYDFLCFSVYGAWYLHLNVDARTNSCIIVSDIPQSHWLHDHIFYDDKRRPLLQNTKDDMYVGLNILPQNMRRGN